MADETQYFDFSKSADPFAGLNQEALASLVPKIPGQPRIDLFKETNTVGRTRETDVTVAHRNVSKKHATLTKDGTMWELSDHGSTNGTYVNEQKVSSPVIISHKDAVSFGDQIYEFIVHSERSKEAPAAPASDPEAEGTTPPSAVSGGAPPSSGMTEMFGSLFQASSSDEGGEAPDSAPAAAPSGSAPQVQFSSGGGASSSGAGTDAPAGGPPQDEATIMRSYDFSEMAGDKKVFATLIEKALQPRNIDLTELRNRIGSAVTNEVRIEDSSVLDEHAEIMFERDGRVRIKTLDNDVIIKVNGEPVKTQFLKDLDVMQIGDIVFTFKLTALPNLDDFERLETKSKSKGKGGVMVVVIILLALVVGGAFIAPKLMGGTSGAPTPAPTTGGPAVKSDYEIALATFDGGKLIEARDMLATMDLEDPEIKELNTAVNVMIDARKYLDSENIVQAVKTIKKLEGNDFASRTSADKLRKSIDYEQTRAADNFYNRAERAMQAERYDEAEEYFLKSDETEADFKDSINQAKRAKLAGMASGAIEKAAELIQAQQYTEGEQVLNEALASIEANRSIVKAGGAVSELEPKMKDYLNFSKMRRLYAAGRGEEALRAAAGLSEELRTRERVDPFVLKMEKVVELAKKVESERDLELAIDLTELEPNSGNAYNQMAQRIVDQQSAAKREEAETYFKAAEEHLANDDRFRALAGFWRAYQLDPTWEEAEQKHDDTANKLLVYAYRLPDTSDFREQKVEIYKWIMDNSEEDHRVYKQAAMQLKRISQ